MGSPGRPPRLQQLLSSAKMLLIPGTTAGAVRHIPKVYKSLALQPVPCGTSRRYTNPWHYSRCRAARPEGIQMALEPVLCGTSRRYTKPWHYSRCCAAHPEGTRAGAVRHVRKVSSKRHKRFVASHNCRNVSSWDLSVTVGHHSQRSPHPFSTSFAASLAPVVVVVVSFWLF